MSKACCGPSDDASKEMNSNEPSPSGATKSSFKVSGMDCADEVSAIDHAFRLKGIHRVESNIMNESVTVHHDASFKRDQLITLIEKAGVRVVQDNTTSFFVTNSSRMYLVGSSGLTLGAGLLLDWIDLDYTWLIIAFYFVSIALGGTLIFPKAYRAISKFNLDMNVLMSVAVVGAIFIKEYSEAASVVFLFSLAELLEALSVDRARKAIRDVLKVSSKDATIVEGTTLKDVSVDTLVIGQIVLVRPGENIPVDGIIVEGDSDVNQASLTGESKAQPKKIGDSVWAGTINESGVLKIRSETDFKDTKISRVIAMVEEAQAQKAPSQKFVDKFASIYSPAVLILALLVAIVPPIFFEGNWNDWIYKALVFLVIGCPCALVIATPVSVVSGLTSLAKRGVVVKGGVYLETLGKLKAIALDKTGTITEGTPKVTELRNFSSRPDGDVLKIAASLESMSTHPLAKAILNYVAEQKIEYPHPSDYKNVAGRGAEGQIEGHLYFVGNHAMAHEFGICTPEIEAYLESVESQSMSIIVVGHRPHSGCVGEILAVFAVGDKVRSNIQEAIKSLHASGVELVVMLSGDNQMTVNSVAKQVGIDYAKGGLLPDQKVEEVKALVAKYKYVGMVGDGVNDAPALAHASIGIAMGVAGSDTAIETADIALMKDDIFELPKAIKHGRKVLNIIRFNIFFAIAIKAVFFVLAFLGYSNLWMAVAADMGASLFVTFNALRLLKLEKK